MIRNTSSSWGSLARWFHWLLGAAIIGLIAFGWWMNHIPARPDRFFYRSIHADIGYLVLLLMVFRLIWRGLNPTPALPVGHAALATDCSERQPLGALRRDHSGGGAGLGAFRRPHAELFGLVRAVSRSADYLARQGSGQGLGGPPYPVRLCAAGADRDPPRGRAVASLRPARPRDRPDDRRRAGVRDLERLQY